MLYRVRRLIGVRCPGRNSLLFSSMIRGNKPSAYGVTLDKNGRKIEVEFRQCSHCQFTWEYKPESGKKRGFCFHCSGLTCGRKVCHDSCAPFWDIAQEMSKKYTFDTRYGIFLRK